MKATPNEEVGKSASPKETSMKRDEIVKTNDVGALDINEKQTGDHLSVETSRTLGKNSGSVGPPCLGCPFARPHPSVVITVALSGLSRGAGLIGSSGGSRPRGARVSSGKGAGQVGNK